MNKRSDTSIHNEKKPFKDKTVSLKVNSEMWEKFAIINRRLGLNNNASVNHLVAKYVLENENLIKQGKTAVACIICIDITSIIKVEHIQ